MHTDARKFLPMLYAISLLSSLVFGPIKAVSEDRSDWIKVDASQAWCGARCILTIARAKGIDCTFEEIRGDAETTALAGQGAEYMSLGQVVEAFERLGIKSGAYVSDLDWLEACLPAIVLLVHPQKTDGHYVIVTKITDGVVYFADPSLGDIVRSSRRDKFQKVWSGHCIVFEDNAMAGKMWTQGFPLLALCEVGTIIVVLTILYLRRIVRRPQSSVAGALFVGVIGCSCMPVGGCSNRTMDAPTIEFSRSSIDLGKLLSGIDDRPIAVKFEFVNKSGREISIQSVATSCSCSVADYTRKTLKPYESGAIEISTDYTGKSGLVVSSAMVSVASTDGEQGYDVMLVCTATIVPSAHPLHEEINFGEVVFGKVNERSSVLTVPKLEDEFKVKLVSDLEYVACLVGKPDVKTHLGEEVSLVYPLQFSISGSGLTAGESFSEICRIELSNNRGRRTIEIPVQGRAGHPHVEVRPKELVLTNAADDGSLVADLTLTRRTNQSSPEPVSVVIANNSQEGQTRLSEQFFDRLKMKV